MAMLKEGTKAIRKLYIYKNKTWGIRGKGYEYTKKIKKYNKK